MTTYGLHRKCSGTETTFYVTSGKSVKKYSEVSIGSWLKALKKSSVVRLMNPSAFDPMLPRIQQTGAQLVYGYWFDLEISKGSEPSAIAIGLTKAPATVFRPFQIRTDLRDLRKLVQMRRAFVDLRTGLSNRVRAIHGGSLDKYSEKAVVAAHDFDFLIADEERKVIRLAKTIPECIILRTIMHQESYLTPAQFIAGLGDPLRFPMVSSLWCYCGLHVVDGVAPKHRAGVMSNFKAELRTILHFWAESALRTSNPYWRPRYDFYRENIDRKRPQWTKGHRMNHALRMISKEVLQQFWAKIHGVEWRPNASVGTLARANFG